MIAGCGCHNIAWAVCKLLLRVIPAVPIYNNNNHAIFNVKYNYCDEYLTNHEDVVVVYHHSSSGNSFILGYCFSVPPNTIAALLPLTAICIGVVHGHSALD